MTLLEELVAERTRLTLGATAVREVELLAEQFANALFKDPVIRARLRVLVDKHLAQAERRLLTGEQQPRNHKGRRKGAGRP